jgi:methylmalonyl-CoA/ethylmalonyl-CoA epimerase
MRSLLIFIALSLSLLTFSALSDNPKKNEPLLDGSKVLQVGMIVKDIDKARTEWAKVLGVEVPGVSIASSNNLRPTKYQGAATNAESKLAFFNLGNLQLELIQPLGGSSTWQEYLDTKGEGIHHLGFSVTGINSMEENFALQEMPTVQSGGWDGGAYSYIDASVKLGCIIELLENYNQ